MSSEKNKGPGQPPARRDAKGRILPGSTANPGGKVKGIEKRMRELIGSQVENWDGRSLDGWEAMTMVMYQVAMGKRPPGEGDMHITMKDRQAAVQFLFDRVHGKAKIMVESDTTLHQGGIANLDVDALTDEELNALEAHVELVAAKASGKAVGKIVDISPADIEEFDPDPDEPKDEP